jgi:hypothetical protein
MEEFGTSLCNVVGACYDPKLYSAVPTYKLYQHDLLLYWHLLLAGTGNGQGADTEK